MEHVDPVLVDYSRQATFDREIRNDDIERAIIIGCGGIGFWLGILLAMTGKVTKMVLFDGDNVEASNLNRLPVPQTWIGQPKVLALKRLVHMLRPDIVVTAVKAHITEDSLGVLVKLLEDSQHCVIDTTDDARAQNLIYRSLKESIKKRNHRYVKVGYEGHTVGAYPTMESWVSADYRPGYRTTNANAITSAVAAGLGLYKLLFGDKHDTVLNLKSFVSTLQKPKSPKQAAVQTVSVWTADVNEAVTEEEEEDGTQG